MCIVMAKKGVPTQRVALPLATARASRQNGLKESALMSALKDLAANRRKSDNGFRAGYLTRVEEMIRREIPTADIRVHPHIYSKVTTWKKNYYSLVWILNQSGVGFNDNGDFKIDCDDEQWAQIVQKDSNSRYMRNKSWPQWNDWKEIFEKDRAEGVCVLDTGDAVNKIYGKSVSSNANSGTSPHMTFRSCSLCWIWQELGLKLGEF